MKVDWKALSVNYDVKHPNNIIGGAFEDDLIASITDTLGEDAAYDVNGYLLFCLSSAMTDVLSQSQLDSVSKILKLKHPIYPSDFDAGYPGADYFKLRYALYTLSRPKDNFIWTLVPNEFKPKHVVTITNDEFEKIVSYARYCFIKNVLLKYPEKVQLKLLNFI